MAYACRSVPNWRGSTFSAPPPLLNRSPFLSSLPPNPLLQTLTVASSVRPPLLSHAGGCGIHSNGGGSGPFGFDPWWWFDDDSSSSSSYFSYLSLLCCSALFSCFRLSSALARTNAGTDKEEEAVWEVRGSDWTKLIPDFVNDAFVAPDGVLNFAGSLCAPALWLRCRELVMRLLLPEGFPDSVTSDYLDYSRWRGVQGVASQISGVLATQALLYAVGLGKGAIPTAAAINWALKDGIGYLSKIMLSKYGRHFDVNPKGWRLFADLLENAAFGLEMLTPAFPHLFVPIGAAAGAGRSAAALIQRVNLMKADSNYFQAATRSCFYAGFAAQRNFAEVIAKGEAQGMVSKSVGIMLGIALASWIGSSTSLAVASFGVVTWIHMYCNLKSYQSIQLRTLNPYRASLVFSEYLLIGHAPSIREVNDEEPLFPAVPLLNFKPINGENSTLLSSEAKESAAEIEHRLLLGSRLSDIVSNKEDGAALFNLYEHEGYILTDHEGKFCVVLKENSSPQDMLKSLFQVNYLYWLERNAGIETCGASADCRYGGRLQIALEYVQREFDHLKADSESVGWVTDGLIARPLPNRIKTGYVRSSDAR